MIRWLVVCLVVAGCGVPAVDPAYEGRGPITFVDSYDLSSTGPIRRRVEAWNARSSSVEAVTYVPMPTPTDDYRAQLMARAGDLAGRRGADAGSQCYDVVTLDVVWTAAFARANYLARLPEAEMGPDRFLPASAESARDNGRLWAVPWRADAGVLFYRSDLLAAEGVSRPTSWDELERQAATIAPKYGIAGYVGQLGQYEGLTVNALEAVWGHGGDADHWDGPGARAGVGRLASGVEQGWIPREALRYDEAASLKEFLEGRALFLRTWPYARAELEASPLKDRFGMAALPGPAALGGWNVAVSRCSAHQATARDFIQFLTGEESQAALLTQAGYPPTLASLYEDRELRARLPHLVVLEAAVLNARNRPRTAHYDELTRVVQRAVHNALGNPQALDAELRQLAEDVVRASSGR
ncbi:ABC transporter substrate-binding protein [Saccharothrix variisporea]|uniref:Multiple sugar transport system substrate-binding protein n=1 Tax=Saccharothrix variisporea TaxID=543527 RepID=A0A495X722_9PSEU|nr:multiple sugar transport system substrate-binding protein [Saccharothrix variisporea]